MAALDISAAAGDAWGLAEYAMFRLVGSANETKFAASDGSAAAHGTWAITGYAIILMGECPASNQETSKAETTKSPNVLELEEAARSAYKVSDFSC